MRIGKTKKEFEELRKAGITDQKGFTELSDNHDPKPNKEKKPKKKPSTLWAVYKVKKASLEEQIRYESFCAGFLTYYDMVVRSGAADHTVWFIWSENEVQVHVDPPPKAGFKNKKINAAAQALAYSDPPKPPPPPPPPMS